MFKFKYENYQYQNQDDDMVYDYAASLIEQGKINLTEVYPHATKEDIDEYFLIFLDTYIEEEE